MNKIDLTNKAKALDLVIQVIVLTMVFVIPEFFFSLGNSRPMSYGMYIHAVLCIITFYFNYFFLIDRYLFRKKTFTYIVLALLTAVVMVMLMVVIQYFIFVNSPDFPQKHNFSTEAQSCRAFQRPSVLSFLHRLHYPRVCHDYPHHWAERCVEIQHAMGKD